jgi:hypothetical protein
MISSFHETQPHFQIVDPLPQGGQIVFDGKAELGTDAKHFGGHLLISINKIVEPQRSVASMYE